MSRLPIPGSDNGTWGAILNDFLKVSHNGDGTLQSSALTQAGAVTLVNSKAPISGSVTLAASDVGALSSTNDLSAIAAANPTANNVSFNSHKITNVANGSTATDAAAFGQIPTVGAAGSGAGNALSANDPTTTNSRTPNGAAGGDLSGTYPNPKVVFGVQNKTANYTLLTTDSIISTDSTGGNVTLTLPDATMVSGRMFGVIKIVAANTVTIGTTAGQTIDGAATLALTNLYESALLVSNGTNYLISSHSGTAATTPGGSNQAIQFNNSGAFGGTSTLYWNGTVFGNPATYIKPASDSVSVFLLQVVSSTSNNALTVAEGSTAAGQVGVGLGSNTGPTLVDTGSNQATGIEIAGGLRLSGGGVGKHLSFITPAGANVATKIAIPLSDPGAFNAFINLGVPSSAVTTARVMALYDARTVSHQPTLGILSPDENNIMGLNWNGSSTLAQLTTSGNYIGFTSGSNELLELSANTPDYLGVKIKPVGGFSNLTFDNATGQIIVTNTLTIGTATSQQLGFYGSHTTQPNSTGTTLGYTTGSSTAVTIDGKFTGNTGTTAYTIGDVVNALKKLGLMAA